jgi:predicted membrane protein
MKPLNWSKRLALGLGVGIAIACVDNFAFGGEVSPIVIVGLLIVSTTTFGGVWGRAGWMPVLAAWMCVPLAHLVKHVLGLPDTLQPNTYTSILMLAAFTLAVATVGTVAGMLIHTQRRTRSPA